MRRILHLWLPQWPIDRRRMAAAPHAGAPAEEPPFATVAESGGRRLLAAVNGAAIAAGLTPGLPLADALAFLPGLKTAAAELGKDAAALRQLAEWCGRYSPWTAPDGADGIKVEITGSAHLWGGELALADDLAARLARRSIACRVAIADTQAAAWAAARFAASDKAPAILPPGEQCAALAALPVEALRLDPATAAALRRLGLVRIGELCKMPRDALAHRFGDAIGRRLDQASGELPEPLSPLGEAPTRRVRLSFAEPIADPADLARATLRLAENLAHWLARDGVGARRLDLAFLRIDNRVERLRIGTASPSRDPRHLARLFEERFEEIDPGPGVEDMILSAFAVEPQPAEQIAFADPAKSEAAGGMAPLIDRLGNRLGRDALYRLEPRESHVPERASARSPVDRLSSENSPSRATRTVEPGHYEHGRFQTDIHGFRVRALAHMPRNGASQDRPPRPIRLFDPPEPIEASFLLPDDPPFRFTWRRRRHRVTQADGPERIAGEWWRGAAESGVGESRDYYRVEDEEGRRFWLFRAGLCPDGDRPRWFLHGVFA